MEIAIKDTTICYAPGHCPNHPNKVIKTVPKPLPQIIIEHDTVAAQLDTAIIAQVKDTLHVEAPQPVKIKMPVFDTLKPVSVSLLNQPTYTPVITQSVRKSPEIEKPMNIDLLCNSVVFGFALYLTANYFATCGAAWRGMFNELRNLA